MNMTAQARARIPVTAELAYLNTASMGPVTTVYAEALAECMAEDIRSGRAVSRRYELLAEARERLRNELAHLLGCRAEQLCLTQSTSAGLEQVIGAFDWAPGDEVIMTDVEHEACAVPLRRVAERSGVRLRVARVPQEPAEDLGWVEALIGPRTRLVAFSAVGFETGIRMPVAEIAGLARDHAVATLLDGAQCAGAADLAPAASGVDFCAMPLQKWLCGPEGLGALYVRERHDRGPGASLAADRVTHGRAVFEATAAQLAWMREELGWHRVFEHTRSLARHARRALRQLDGATLLTPACFAGITTFRCPFTRTAAAGAELERRGIVVRHLPELSALRVSTACFNTEDEIDALVSALAEAAAR